MRCTLAGFLALLLFLPALWADDDKDRPKKSPTPAEEYQALVKEYQQTQEEFTKALQTAKTNEERQKAFKEKRPKPEQFTGRFLAVARRAPKDPVGFEALSWVVRFGGFQAAKDAGTAAEMLLRDHVKNPQMSQVCQSLMYANFPAAEKLLRAVLDKNPDHDAQGTACYVLATRLQRQAPVAGRKPTAGPKKLNQEADQLLDRLARDYIDVAWVRATALAPNSSASPKLIRAVLEKATNKDEKGKGYYSLAVRLKRDAEQAAQNGKSADAETLNQEVEQLLDQVAKEYAGVPFNGRKLGDIVKTELFEIRHLSIGKKAPEIAGEDIDGKKMKLSDFRGKVVLLDFWGNW